MPGGNASLLDSNILLRLSKSDENASVCSEHWIDPTANAGQKNLDGTGRCANLLADLFVLSLFFSCAHFPDSRRN